MSAFRRKGFTLIELLTVIAIIAILSGITFSAFSRVREAAKLRRVVNSMQQIRTMMTAYYGQNNSYPPGYGFVKFSMRSENPADHNEDEFYYLRPYTVPLRIFDQEDLYDEFSYSLTGYDTNRDGLITLGEFLPYNMDTSRPDIPPVFSKTRFNGNNIDTIPLLQSDLRPFVYAPVYMRHFKQAQKYWIDIGIETGNFNATAWDPNDQRLRGVTFPPPEYDAFVLISMGPAGNTFGVLPTDPGYVQNLLQNFPRGAYHILAMRTFYLATRDLNNNGQLDFDYQARTGQGEAGLVYSVGSRSVDNKLPNAEAPDGYGPLIFKHP
jgi:prepilin-type N-terminal cleavage/methylation domain-containing protein